jgi:ribosomal protein L12E/L44/L45/RPP1/RPP2
MSETLDQHDDQADGDQQVTLSRANIRKLEKAAQAGQSAQSELASLKRELAFRDAGISPTNPMAKYFIKGYDGESTVEAIKAAAEEAGLLAAAPPPPNPDAPPQQPNSQVRQDELVALQRANGMTAAPQAPSVSQEAAYFAALNAAKTPQEVMEVVQKFGVPTTGME